MSGVERLVRRRFLTEFLTTARRTAPPNVAVAVWRDQDLLAGDVEACSAHPAAMSLPLEVEGHAVGRLVVLSQPAAASPPADGLAAWAQLLAVLLQGALEAELARRAVAAEALNAYRELAHLHRAATTFNQSLHAADVAAALLAELGRSTRPAQAAIVLQQRRGGAGFEPLRQQVIDPAIDSRIDLAPIARSRLFAMIVDSGKGQIVNDLAGVAGWQGEVPEIGALLAVPFVIDGEALGALVLVTMAPGREFAAADLKQAATLASMAAASLRNAQLFEEVLEVKNYNETILENLTSGVVTLDNAGLVAKANTAALAMLGRVGTKLAGEPAAAVWRDVNDWVLQSLALLPEDGAPQLTLDQVIQDGDGGSTSVNLIARPLANVARETIGTILLFENITREKRIKSTMARFMSDRVVDQLLLADDLALGGNAQEVSILFSDIRGFTRLAEHLTPRELVARLNDYFAGMVDILFEQDGMLDKFIGDALMAVFGAPFVTGDDPERAIEAAVQMVRRLRADNERWVAAGRPPLGISIGINTGEVVAGTIGSPRRMEYTVIGDHVNLASRIEAVNRQYGTEILASEYTIARLESRRRVRELDRVKVKGRQQPVRLFEILDHHDAASFPNLDEVLGAFAAGLGHYREGAWQRGAACFADALRGNPADRPTQIFLHRCWTLMARPPDAGWTDVTELGLLGA